MIVEIELSEFVIGIGVIIAVLEFKGKSRCTSSDPFFAAAIRAIVFFFIRNMDHTFLFHCDLNMFLIIVVYRTHLYNATALVQSFNDAIVIDPDDINVICAVTDKIILGIFRYVSDLKLTVCTL